MRIAGTIVESVVDGPGVRYVVFFQGCPHHCEGCHNPQTWDPEGGYETSVQDIIDDIKLHQGIIRGITISGGEPFAQPKALVELISQIYLQIPMVTTMVYTGYYLQDLQAIQGSNRRHIQLTLSLLDYLVDGPFKQELKKELPYRGSSNQNFYCKNLDKFVIANEAPR